MRITFVPLSLVLIATSSLVFLGCVTDSEPDDESVEEAEGSLCAENDFDCYSIASPPPPSCPAAGQYLRSTCMCGRLVDYLTDGLGGEYASTWGPGSCGPTGTCSYGQPFSDQFCYHQNLLYMRFVSDDPSLSTQQTMWLGYCNQPLTCQP